MTIDDIQYDTPIEVTMGQYYNIMHKCNGIVAGRRVGDKFYIKVWLMKYIDQVVKASVL